MKIGFIGAGKAGFSLGKLQAMIQSLGNQAEVIMPEVKAKYHMAAQYREIYRLLSRQLVEIAKRKNWAWNMIR